MTKFLLRMMVEFSQGLSQGFIGGQESWSITTGDYGSSVAVTGDSGVIIMLIHDRVYIARKGCNGRQCSHTEQKGKHLYIGMALQFWYLSCNSTHKSLKRRKPSRPFSQSWIPQETLASLEEAVTDPSPYQPHKAVG